MNTQIKTITAVLAAIGAAALLAGCASPKTVERSAKGQLLQDAEQYVSGLRQQNQLPGFRSDEHGRLIAAAPWAGGDVTYPASVSVHAWKQGETSSYRYDLARETPEAPWRLVSATRQDTSGRVIERLLPK